MRRRHKGLLIAAAVLAVAIAAGPWVQLHPLIQPPLPQAMPQAPAALQAWVDAGERAVSGLRPDNQARIVWADPAHPALSSICMDPVPARVRAHRCTGSWRGPSAATCISVGCPGMV